jgi:poly-gamma-glutamate synthesis protein (capsule biosynthesis protein)
MGSHRGTSPLLAALCAFALTAAACGSDSDTAADSTPATTADSGATTTEATGSTTAPQASTAAPDGQATTAAPPTTATPATSPPTTAAPEPTVPPKGSTGAGNPVTIAFGGDTHFEGLLADQLASAPLTMLDPVAAMMAEADLAIVNLETTITDRGTTVPGKAFNFRTTPEAFDALRSAGIDAVTIANNHGLDFGLEGLEDSIAAAEAKDFPMVGIGMDDDEAYRPWSTEVNGQRIALIGATQVIDNNLISSWTATSVQPGLASAKEVTRLVETVEQARLAHDTVVVFLHWGIEGETCPAPRQLELADALVAAGADIIVGGHAHRVQGGGMLDGAFVHYGLGNFIFYSSGGPGTTSGVAEVTITGRRVDSYRWIPARVTNGVATEVEGAAGTDAVAAWDQLRDCTNLNP